jgi:hypothetical protein
MAFRTNSNLDNNARQGLIVSDNISGVARVVTGVSLANAQPIHVAIVDGAGSQITSFGGGTQYTNGSAQATPTGTVALGYDGANVRALSTDSSGKLNVNTITGTVTISGTVTANAGTSLNTSLLALESGGNLATLAGGVSASKYQVNIAQVGGSSLALGQTTKSASLPVTLASDQGNLGISGTVTANIGTTNGLALDATLTGGTQQTKITNGTSIADVLAGDSGLNSVVTASGTKTYTFTTSLAGAQTLLANTSLEGYSWIEIIYTSVGSGLALTGQFAPNTGGTYINTGSIWSAGTTGNGPLGTTVSTLYAAATHGNFFQLNVTALTSGTFSGYVILRATPPPNTGVLASQNGNWSLQGNSATATGTITTNASSILGTTNNGYGGFSQISVHGSYAGVSFGITESDDSGTTYYNVPIYDAAANAWLAPGATITPGTNASKMYWVPVVPTAGIVKVLASAYTSGTATIRILAAQTNFPGSTMAQLMDAAGNNRGANVDGNNNLMVNVAAGLAPASTTLNTYSVQISTNTTTTPVSSTSYIAMITIVTATAGTGSTLTIQDKQGTPLKIVDGLVTTSVPTLPNVVNFQTPAKMVSGIDIVTAGAVAATNNVWINYYA